MEKLKFLMGLHCHQPVDNFGYIFEGAYNKSYEPFLSVLGRHPGIKLSLHYSGSILDWLLKNKPHFIQRIKNLSDKGQVELLTGGYHEPVLHMIPVRDRKAQIEKLTRAIKKHFNCEANGAWLTERIWDPSISAVYKDLGLKYTIVDDYHLRCAGLKEEQVYNRYSLKGFEEFSVFASIKHLRYIMPFREPDITIDYLHRLKDIKDVKSVTFADDCEKFGFWPHTYNWVYKKGWLDKFFTKLEKDDEIKTLTFTEAIQEVPSSGSIDMPHSSYEEMAEWSSGNFNNFFKKYPESDRMRKRMIFLSDCIESKEQRSGVTRQTKVAKEELYKAQSNCAYWHGIFGGIYMNFLRQGIYGHIIKAENILKESKIDMNGMLCAKNKFLTLTIDPDYTGSIPEIDYHPLNYNLVNTMARRYEPYHEELKKRKKLKIESIKKKVDEDYTIDLYEVLGIKERNLKRFLEYDPYPKFSGLCHIMKLRTSFGDFMKSRHVSTGEGSLFGHYREKKEENNEKLIIELEKDSHAHIGGRFYSLKLNKCFILEKDSGVLIRFILQNNSPEKAVFLFGIEFNWSVEDGAFLRGRRMKNIKELEIIDKYTGIKIKHIFKELINAWSFPVYTINESEGGLEKTFQEISLLFHKKVALEPSGTFSVDMALKVSK